MSIVQAKAKMPFFIPQPQVIELQEGVTELSPDVRLATSNVIPFMRKTMRSIFTASAIRVVANKKRFVIQVNIVDEADAHWEDVPEELRLDYYRMDIVNNVVTISSPSQVGAIWGVQSFADLYQASGPDTVIPNCVIRDWATTPIRGAMIRATHMSKRMRLEEYSTIVDRLARSRMNTLIVGLYGSARAPECPMGDTLLASFPGHPELTTQAALFWETPQPAPVPEGTHDPAPPVMVADDYLGGLIDCGRERGVTVVPSLDLIEARALLRKACPSAGRIDDDKCREFFAELYGDLLSRYSPDGMAFFHVSLAGAAAAGDAADYAAWLVETLTAKGVGNVVIDSEAATAAVMGKLAQAGLADKVVVLGDGGAPGGTVWSVSALDGRDWRSFATIDQDYDVAVPAGLKGIICRTSIDSTWVFEEYLAAVKGWNLAGTEDLAGCRERAMKNIAGRFSKEFMASLPLLRKACSLLPEVLTWLPVNAPGEGRAYVETVEKALGADAVAKLDALATAAKTAYQQFLPMVTTEGESTPFPTVTKTFVGECARIAGVARACAVAIAARQGKPLADVNLVVEEFTEMMQGVSSYKPRHMVPVLLGGMTMLRNLLKSLG